MIRLAVLPVLLIVCSVPSHAQFTINEGPSTRGNFTINEPDTTGSFNFRIDLGRRVQQDFFIQGDRLENSRGRPVRAYGANSNRDIIVGTIDPSVEYVTINQVDETDSSYIVAVSFIHKDGRHRSLLPSMITAHHASGENRCFSVEPIGGQFNPVTAHVLIDRSGSMNGHIGSVQRALREFAAVLPNTSQCRFTSFANDMTDHTNGFQSCRSASVAIASIQAGGGTNLFPTLRQSYADFRRISSNQKFMLVVTDGEDTSGQSLRDVLSEKTAQTFVLWAGNQRPEFLGELPDATLSADGNIGAAISAFFKTLGEVIAQQQVLVLPKLCPATQPGDQSGSVVPLLPTTKSNTAIAELDTQDAIAPAASDQAPTQQAAAPIDEVSLGGVPDARQPDVNIEAGAFAENHSTAALEKPSINTSNERPFARLPSGTFYLIQHTGDRITLQFPELDAISVFSPKGQLTARGLSKGRTENETPLLEYRVRGLRNGKPVEIKGPIIVKSQLGRDYKTQIYPPDPTQRSMQILSVSRADDSN